MQKTLSTVVFHAILCVLVLAGPVPACAQPSLDELKNGFRRPALAVATPEEVAARDVGRALFFDPGLSATGSMSCASCHDPAAGWKDGRARPLDNRGLALPRRSPTLLNLAWAPLLTWDGRMKSLEQQATDPIVNPRMGALNSDAIVGRVVHVLDDPALAARYRVAFGTAEVTLDTVSRALAAFERSLVSPPAPFDRWIEGKSDVISPAAQRGFALFNGRGNCAACHEGWRFTDDGFHDIGLPDADLGRGAKVPGEPTLMHAFKTPTLRDVVAPGPFMHDGSVPTLAAVLDHYDGHFVRRDSLDPEMRVLDLSNEERSDLLAFLASLTSTPMPLTGTAP